MLEVPASRLLRAELTADPTWPGAPDETEGGWRRFEELRLEPILDASARLFVRQGFHATSVREIAAEARVSVAGIYHHYPSKEDILVALLDLTMAEIKWRLIAARGEGSSPP